MAQRWRGERTRLHSRRAGRSMEWAFSSRGFCSGDQTIEHLGQVVFRLLTQRYFGNATQSKGTSRSGAEELEGALNGPWPDRDAGAERPRADQHQAGVGSPVDAQPKRLPVADGQ